MSEMFSFGQQSTWFEEPDLIVLKLQGTMTTEESIRVNGKQVEMCAGREEVFMLVDMSTFSSIAPAGRKAASEALNQMPLRGVAVHQAGLAARVLGKLVIAGVNLFKKDESARFPVHFFETEEAARAWIEELRQGLAPAA